MTNQDVSNIGFFEEPSSPDQDAMVGRILSDRYRIESELGRGGMGIVYLAEDTQARCKVAIKMLTGAAARSPDLRTRFEREAATAARLSHPGICGVQGFGEFEGLPFIAMDYLRGRSLADLLDTARGHPEDTVAESTQEEQAEATLVIDKAHMARSLRNGQAAAERTSSVSVDDMVRVIEKAARALHVAHEAGLVHRDIKPGNIMLSPEGDPVILDFGLARDIEAVGQTLTESGQIVGTPAYLAPEQIVGRRAEVDRRSDIYALGVTLYECLTLERPFRGATWDQLFHQILSGEWISPRKLNPHMPAALGTVVETAMERERHRRYQTAEDLAEDLRRIRSFEPIKARPPGPVLRLRRWARRRPGRAAAAAAATVIVLAATIFLVQGAISRSMALREKLSLAESLLGSSDFAGATEALAQARELDPNSSRAAELKLLIDQGADAARREARRQADLAAAATEREESSQKTQQHRLITAEIKNREAALALDRVQAFDTFAPDAERGRFAAREREIDARRVEAERLRQEAEESLQRAARLESAWGGPSVETNEAFAGFYLALWREAVDAGDSARAAWLRAAVENHDRNGRHAGALLGRGSLRVTVEPEGAQVHLFRYEEYQTVRPGDPIPRLVPVPTAGVGLVRPGPWFQEFYPGDPSLVISGVETGSLAAAQGLEVGDIVVTLNGHPCGQGVFVHSVASDAQVSGSSPRPLERMVSVNGTVLDGAFEWINAAAPDGGNLDSLVLDGREEPILIDRRAVRPATPRGLVEREAVADMELGCLRDGEPVTLRVPAGQRSGLLVDVDAYPLILAAANQIGTGQIPEIDPGSYLLIASHPGFETQRYPVVVPRLGRVEHAIKLLPADSTPKGTVYIPPGPFLMGGDPAALLSGPRTERDLPGFFMFREEVTNAEWFEFVNDPNTLRRIEESGETRYLPRDSKGLIARKKEDGTGYDRGAGYPTTPVLGVSWNDIKDFLIWRNEKAQHTPWIYDLPTQAEWEKAARGVDGRFFPWGNRFDHALTVSEYRKGKLLLDAPGGFEVRDTSPFGVHDLAGSREEWTSDRFEGGEPGAPAAYHVKGGAWGSAVVNAFRAAACGYKNADAVGGNTGFRLVLRPRP